MMRGYKHNSLGFFGGVALAACAALAAVAAGA